jgi:hypothetical protein
VDTEKSQRCEKDGERYDVSNATLPAGSNKQGEYSQTYNNNNNIDIPKLARAVYHQSRRNILYL